ncbi:hypothetical protein [Candidatus Cardinium sp. TP]|uniref:hypothetical protein n=1 Tax=Candidatus Cardinium sp. TP TaxID=2961955 RepID=UPI0021AF8225|nr:hypothetical protein [Candidatus Cardinium sp. TP]MCT4696842.1 hypothetical protein [Candidatus Cardinium sp. TP]MDN5247449.1 hypothetical protein [Candidatus Cardinium sp.]
MPTKQTHLPYSFYLAVLLSLATSCPQKTTQRNLPLSNQVKNGPNAMLPTSPSSEVAQKKGLNTTPPDSLKQGQSTNLNTTRPVSPTPPPVHSASSKKTDQISIINHLEQIIQNEKSYGETFSKALKPVENLDERDKMIAAFVKERDRRVGMLNQRLIEIVDPNERQRLIKEFEGTKEMCQKVNAMGRCSSNVLEMNQEKYEREVGDIVERYNGYLVESRRPQFKRQVKDMINLVAKHPSIFPNKQEQDAQCAICHKTESVGLLPCGDYVHVNCLVEKMISVWRQSMDLICRCPGSCSGYLNIIHFLSYNSHEKKLTLDSLKEIISKRGSISK